MHDIHQICEEDGQQDLGLKTEKVTEMGAVTLTDWSRERSPETSYKTVVEDKTQGCSEHISKLSLSGPNALVPVGFLENQVTIQNLQLQVEETSNENLRLCHVIEECDQKVESLLNEIKGLDSKLDLQKVQLTTKTEACLELEKIVEELKKEKSNLREELESFSCDNQELHQRREGSEDLDSNLKVGTDELSHQVIEDKISEMNDKWRERLLDVENELKRIEAEKGSIEHRALSVEADLEGVQAEKLYLERDVENKQKVITCLQEELSVVINERNQLHGELDTLSKDRKELDLMSEKMKEKIQELKSHQGECLHHINIGAEVEDKMQLLQTLSSEVSKVIKDKAYLQEQLQNLEKDSQALSLEKSELEDQTRQLNKEKTSLVRESESLQSKLSELEHEKLDIAKALEAALMEKGEVAVRLSSTQEELHQLRKGIEKLRVRVEADEKKQLHVLQKLKESERRNDSLQDKVENLERELQMSEENQELVILDAENAKAEVETLKTQAELVTESLKALELDLVAVRSEKDNLTKRLQEKQGQVSELDTLLSSFKNLLEEKEQEKIQMQEASRAAMEMLQTQLKELNEEVAALCNDQETWKVQEQSLDPPVQQVHQLRSSIEKLKVDLEANEKKQLHVLGKLKESEHDAVVLKDRVENLERDLEISGKNQEHVILEAKSSKAEVETLKAQIEENAQNLSKLELDLVKIRSEKENLTKELQNAQGRVSELEILNSSFESLLQEKEVEKVQMKEDAKIAVEVLQTQLKELNEKVAAWKAKEQALRHQVDSLQHEKAQLLQGLEEAKNNHIILQSSVSGLIQEAEDSKQKLEKKDEEISVLKMRIQEQEQLFSKLSQLEGEQQLWKKQKVELEHLAVELEQKVQELQSRNSTLQDTSEALQKSCRNLEEELELTKMEKMSFVEKVSGLVYLYLNRQS